MNTQEAAELAERIIAQAADKVSVKVGATNGEGRVHLNYERRSVALKSPEEWDEHPLNRRNAPRKARTKRERQDEASAETVLSAIDEHTIYTPED